METAFSEDIFFRIICHTGTENIHARINIIIYMGVNCIRNFDVFSGESPEILNIFLICLQAVVRLSALKNTNASNVTKSVYICLKGLNHFSVLRIL